MLPNNFSRALEPFLTYLSEMCLLRSQAARGKEGIKDGVSEMGTRLDPVPGLPGGEFVCVCVCIDGHWESR